MFSSIFAFTKRYEHCDKYSQSYACLEAYLDTSMPFKTGIDVFYYMQISVCKRVCRKKGTLWYLKCLWNTRVV
jgi:hypothetical protein